MTDLHCHALCFVDDGAKDIEEMKQMIDIAYNDGIKKMCFTPHFKAHHFKNDAQISSYNEKIKESFSMALEYARDKYSDMELYLGNEIMHHHDIYDSLSSGKCAFLAGSSYALVEFLPSASYFEIQGALSSLLRKGVKPILAHAERYSSLVSDVSRVDELKEMGVLIQINAGSIAKMKLGKCAKFIKTLFKRSLVDIVASDAHDTVSFAPIMSRAYGIICKKYGESVARSTCELVPNLILENKKVH
jgi:protein-tyrosine phosphatase